MFLSISLTVLWTAAEIVENIPNAPLIGDRFSVSPLLSFLPASEFWFSGAKEIQWIKNYKISIPPFKLLHSKLDNKWFKMDDLETKV